MQDLDVIDVSFGKEMTQTAGLAQNMDEMDDNFDAFNDETFGDIDTDWETEHEKLMSISDPNRSHDNTAADINRNTFAKNTSLNESHNEEDMHFVYDDIVSKNISNLVLEDEEFEDPAIMTFSRSAKPLMDSSRRDSRSSPPPPAFLSYEEYSASPKTSSIWSTTQMDTTLTPSSVNMRTLEEIEGNLIHKNSDNLSQLSTIQRPIRMEDLETSLMNESIAAQMGETRVLAPEQSWSPFGSNSMHGYLQNGRMASEMMSSLEPIERNLLSNESLEPIERNLLSNESSNQHKNLDINAIQSAARLALSASHDSNQSMDPLLKAQTLADIEQQLISGQSRPQKPQMAQNVPKPEATVPVMRSNTLPNIQSPIRAVNQQMSAHVSQQMRPQMSAMNQMHNRVNNMYNRPPVMHIMPGMHPAMGRTMFSPALIPNSQRIFPYPLQRPIMHPLLHPMQLQHQFHQQRHHQNYQNNFRHQNRYHENYDNEDDYSGLM
ncbi:unnamed protein product, partial [Oppiella nova]